MQDSCKEEGQCHDGVREQHITALELTDYTARGEAQASYQGIYEVHRVRFPWRWVPRTLFIMWSGVCASNSNGSWGHFGTFVIFLSLFIILIVNITFFGIFFA